MEKLLLKALGRFISTGNLVLEMPGGDRHSFGDGNGGQIVLRFNSSRAIRRMVFSPSLGFGEAFMAGEIDVAEGDLLDLTHLAFINGNYDHAMGLVGRLNAVLRHASKRLRQINTPGRARNNVHHHYDLSGKMYRMFLDEDMQYSCAYFEHDGQSLDEAQKAKKRLIAAKLNIQPGQSVLEIGSGWGGLALYLARELEASVYGVTLSDEQLAVSRQRAAEAGLSDRVQFELQDYRAIARQFDRIVSVGMFEHVGVNHYATYFEKSAKLLKPGGVMLLHTIGRSGMPAVTDPFIARYIFPGGYIPSLSEVMPHVERCGLVVSDVEILRLHYADTLKAWRARFLANRDAIRAMLDEPFCRMWELYLASSEAAFRWGDLVVFQIQLTNDKAAVPVTRDYIAAGQDQLRASDSRGKRKRSRQSGLVVSSGGPIAEPEQLSQK